MTARDVGEELTTEMTILINVRTKLGEQIEERFKNLRQIISELEDELKREKQYIADMHFDIQMRDQHS